MPTGWRYRSVSVAGILTLTAAAVAVANHPLVQAFAVSLPVMRRLPASTLTNGALSLAIATTLVVVVGACLPLFKPQPRRRLDTLVLAEKRVLLAVFSLAAVGYFDYTYRLPRTTLLLLCGVLALSVPTWFVLIRGRPDEASSRVVIVGDDPESIEDVLWTVDVPVIGYISPPSPHLSPASEWGGIGTPDGGQVVQPPRLDDLQCLGGLSRLTEVLVQHDVDTAVLAFSHPDRAEFFGALDTCYEYGVTAKVHRDHADTVLTADSDTADLVDVDLEPWDWQDYVLKRVFDVCFASVALVALAPVMALIALAVKFDSEGPVLYSQERTAELGDTFTVYKFRTMRPESEDSTPVDDADNDRITRTGRILRATHLDELPQLGSILVGDMSVVGPRAAWTEEEIHLERTTTTWRKRWFVKPGLTGLAQVHDVSSTTPEQKLRYDVTYIRQQSFWFDLKILVRQLWMVVVDAVQCLIPRGRASDR